MAGGVPEGGEAEREADLDGAAAAGEQREARDDLGEGVGGQDALRSDGGVDCRERTYEGRAIEQPVEGRESTERGEVPPAEREPVGKGRYAPAHQLSRGAAQCSTEGEAQHDQRACRREDGQAHAGERAGVACRHHADEEQRAERDDTGERRARERESCDSAFGSGLAELPVPVDGRGRLSGREGGAHRDSGDRRAEECPHSPDKAPGGEQPPDDQCVGHQGGQLGEQGQEEPGRIRMTDLPERGKRRHTAFRLPN
jgi:hypothetical protein